MKLLGLTGGVGMGKSTAAEILRAHGCEVIDTDAISHQLVQCGMSALNEIEETFGSKFIDEAGELKRRELADLVFLDSDARRRLESILHPRIRAVWRDKITQWRENRIPLGVVVIPLLFETGAQTEFDAIVVVACALQTQKARLIQRGWSEIEIERRIAAQLASNDKVARADWVVWSEGTQLAHQKQLERILALAA